VKRWLNECQAAQHAADGIPAPIEATIVRLKREYPRWGAPKIREKLA